MSYCIRLQLSEYKSINHRIWPHTDKHVHSAARPTLIFQKHEHKASGVFSSCSIKRTQTSHKSYIMEFLNLMLLWRTRTFSSQIGSLLQRVQYSRGQCRHTLTVFLSAPLTPRLTEKSESTWSLFVGNSDFHLYTFNLLFVNRQFCINCSHFHFHVLQLWRKWWPADETAVHRFGVEQTNSSFITLWYHRMIEK